jgi:RNA polymerase sigma-70 factor, ECF subfamily
LKEIFTNFFLDGLARDLKKGNKEAGGKIFDYFSSKIYAFTLARVGNQDTAEDITQSVFLKIIQKIETFDDQRGNFSGWVWQIVRNTLVDYYREKKTVPFLTKSEEGEGEYVDVVDEKQSPWEELRVQEILTYIKKWDEEEQEIFMLHYISSFSYSEIAKMTGKKEGNLRVTIHRLRKRLQQALYEA